MILLKSDHSKKVVVVMSRAYEVNDDAYPFTSIAYIVSTFPNGNIATGTGFLVGMNDVLTASHVVYSGQWGGDAVSVKVIPSYDPDSYDNEAFFAWDWLRYTDFDPNFDGRLISGDFQSISHQGAEKDIALLTVNGGLGKYGWFGIDYNHYIGTFTAENAGYPGVYGRQPMYDTGTIYGSRIDNVYFESYGLDVNAGNSGGPIYYTNDSGPFALGLVSTGSYYTALSGHEFWLRDAIRENDDSIGLEYIASHADLISAFGTNYSAGVAHFENFGITEGRLVQFNGLEYIASHDDLIMVLGADRTAGANHYIEHGFFEGRLKDAFDAHQYLENYGDLAAAYGEDSDLATWHFILYGFYEGRSDEALFV